MSVQLGSSRFNVGSMAPGTQPASEADADDEGGGGLGVGNGEMERRSKEQVGMAEQSNLSVL